MQSGSTSILSTLRRSIFLISLPFFILGLMLPVYGKQIGYGVERIRTEDPLRLKVNSDKRLDWDRLFFLPDLTTPLSKALAGLYAMPLEMVRRAPSAHNYQPWRVIKEDSRFHFHLQRTCGYGPGSPMFMLLGVADLQRIEIGIAMCHFELTARELALEGGWLVQSSSDHKMNEDNEYVATWQAG